MTPLKQRLTHDPANGVYGDCHRACVASIFDLPLEAVPHFCDGTAQDDEGGEIAKGRERHWLRERGFGVVSIPFPAETGLAAILNMLSVSMAESHYIVGGRSANGFNHSVIARGGAIVHDPSMNDAGIVGPCDDGHFWIDLYVALDPAGYLRERRVAA